MVGAVRPDEIIHLQRKIELDLQSFQADITITRVCEK